MVPSFPPPPPPAQFTSAYLLFYTAEYQCEFSGILAVVVYGMSYPAYGKTRFSPGMGKVVEEFLYATAEPHSSLALSVCVCVRLSPPPSLSLSIRGFHAPVC